MTVRFVVPGSPLSINRVYGKRGKGKGLCLTPRGRGWKDTVRAYAAQARQQLDDRKLLTGPIEVWIRSHFSSANSDTDGPCKPTLDAMQTMLYRNDHQVHRVVLERSVDAVNPRADIRVRPGPFPDNLWDYIEHLENRVRELEADKLEVG